MPFTLGDFSKAKIYRDRRANFMRVIESVFYNDTTGAWHDYNMRLKQHNTAFYSSVAVPLFTNSYLDLDQSKSKRLFQYMKVRVPLGCIQKIRDDLIVGSRR